MSSKPEQKTILLAVSSSIAIYKSCELCRRLKERGANVYVAMTENAQKLVSPILFESLSGNAVITGMFSNSRQPVPISHISLSHVIDLFIIAPATANLIAKSACGIADDWITTSLLATTAPVLWAPAMNPQMYTNPATQKNIQILSERGHHFIGPFIGTTACGEVGQGRMAELEIILEKIDILLTKNKNLTGKKVLITSGPTQEPIDPVRYISNRSSGKMGRELALEAIKRGAEVTVVSGPSVEKLPYHSNSVYVQTAQEMYEQVLKLFPECDVFIASAAVADYSVIKPLEHKKKRTDEALLLELTPNPDILGEMGKRKNEKQIVIGFAAETNNLIENAKEKLRNKNLDLIVVNKVGGEKCAFGSEFAYATIITPDGIENEPSLTPKRELVQKLYDKIEELLKKKEAI
ncbi:MAG: bifunctional phosphopantothenoylcysteine decarboxylase/phosphopantothenate--cysteine ligase CoaBC [Candidatus Hydrogenedentes bacterium]|nr:bifunctional phosphopantothenoylcysteine decarboxylase/phosphopantothenate--cysteine ligase CoaBC [Candidatus Hydrogenedentota bacterium]